MLTVAIQAGGDSRRMGQDKALIPFLGKPLIQRVMERVAMLADEILVTTNNPEAFGFLQVPLVMDILPGTGALGGLYTALYAAAQPLVAVVACDMPFVNSQILSAARHLLEETSADVAIARTEEGFEPFHAVYRREACLAAVRLALAAGERKLISWFPAVQVALLPTEIITRCDPQQLAFWNLNTPQELAQAEALARSSESALREP
jgi:molybdopterin-guanine dinucleotide biosynthesis protein A